MIAAIAFLACGLLCQHVDPIISDICLVMVAASSVASSDRDEYPTCSRRAITVSPTPLKANICSFSDAENPISKHFRIKTLKSISHYFNLQRPLLKSQLTSRYTQPYFTDQYRHHFFKDWDRVAKSTRVFPQGLHIGSVLTMSTREPAVESNISADFSSCKQALSGVKIDDSLLTPTAKASPPRAPSAPAPD